MSVHLCGVYCPQCQERVTTVALEAGPQLVRHHSVRERDGERRKCRGQWVVVPDRERRHVDLKPVTNHHEATQVLESETARWLRDFLALYE